MITINEDLRQKHVEAFFAALRELGADNKSGPEFAGSTVRAALQSGVVSGAEVDSVAEMKPGSVAALSQKINDALSEALAIEGE